MIRRYALFLALAALSAGAFGCSGQQAKAPADGTLASSTGNAASGDFKIGIMTGTVSQNEEEYRAGQQVAAKYPGRVKHVTYPDNFMTEQETVIAQMVGLAADPEVKVIIAGQAIPGSVAAARKIREQRPDILIGFVEAHEDPAIVNETADVSVQPDQLARGSSIIQEAKAMGATTFVHYSFPRHMSQELLSRRRDIMKQEAEKNGMKFVFVTAPDPMAEGGLPATQQFVLEDQPREVKKYGPGTAFFSTNCGMQEPMIKSVLNNGGYVPEQCCPSPTHGYPTALGIAIPPDKAGDIDFINSENKRVIAAAKMSGHFGTWVAPESMVAIRAVVNLLVDEVATRGAEAGAVDHKDMATVQKYLEAEAKAPVQIAKYDQAKGSSYLIMLNHQVY